MREGEKEKDRNGGRRRKRGKEVESENLAQIWKVLVGINLNNEQ